MPTTLRGAAEAVAALLSGLPAWPDDLEIEKASRRKLARGEVEVAVFRVGTADPQDMSGDGLMGDQLLGTEPGASVFRHTGEIRVSVRLSGPEGTARDALDAMLSEAGPALDLDRTLGGLVADVIPGGVRFDWDDAGRAGEAFHEAEFSLTVLYDSLNPIT